MLLDARDDLGSALTGVTGPLIMLECHFCGSDWALVEPGGVDFATLPAALHHPVALWEGRWLLVSALVFMGTDWGGLYLSLGRCQEREEKDGTADERRFTQIVKILTSQPL